VRVLGVGRGSHGLASPVSRADERASGSEDLKRVEKTQRGVGTIFGSQLKRRRAGRQSSLVSGATTFVRRDPVTGRQIGLDASNGPLFPESSVMDRDGTLYMYSSQSPAGGPFIGVFR
jgi:hypothetical protein